MNCKIRKWKETDASALAAALNNKKILEIIQRGEIIPNRVTKACSSFIMSRPLSLCWDTLHLLSGKYRLFTAKIFKILCRLFKE